MTHLLVIDDDQRLADLLSQYFSRHEISMAHALRPSDGLKQLSQSTFDLVILDIMLPEMDGFEVCKEIRKHSEIPIIMLTARGEVMDRIVGLELGADDYLAKPFEPRELIARIHTVLKRSSFKPDAKSGLLEFDTLRLDLNRKEAFIDHQLLPLSSSEYQLLELFAQHPGKTLSRDDILSQLKGVDLDIYTRAVDILISRLRQKLKPLDVIKTIRSRGYCFVGQAK